MRGFLLGVSLSVAFIGGTLFGGLTAGLPAAQAQKNISKTILMRWEYLCIDKMDRDKMAVAGQQGWELVGGAAGGSANALTEGSTMVWCFKRPIF